ncbi:hypothetical protein PIB30_082529 [Stylosanthes scabra]|uniref:DUF4283 domain-containing protein n=1 Tax=Stylosanthes scabra TaxID=79078 RepID=A0ABU6XS45_9FABA|nr:hypothetical protein [Stylosanthes scabra]
MTSAGAMWVVLARAALVVHGIRKRNSLPQSVIVELIMRYYSNHPPIATQITDHNQIPPIDKNPRPVHQIPNDETNRITMKQFPRARNQLGISSINPPSSLVFGGKRMKKMMELGFFCLGNRDTHLALELKCHYGNLLTTDLRIKFTDIHMNPQYDLISLWIEFDNFTDKVGSTILVSDLDKYYGYADTIPLMHNPIKFPTKFVERCHR